MFSVEAARRNIESQLSASHETGLFDQHLPQDIVFIRAGRSDLSLLQAESLVDLVGPKQSEGWL